MFSASIRFRHISKKNSVNAIIARALSGPSLSSADRFAKMMDVAEKNDEHVCNPIHHEDRASMELDSGVCPRYKTRMASIHVEFVYRTSSLLRWFAYPASC